MIRRAGAFWSLDEGSGPVTKIVDDCAIRYICSKERHYWRCAGSLGPGVSRVTAWF